MAGQKLDELEGIAWGEPTFDSHLVTTCRRHRAKPLDEFTAEDLRVMVGQQIGLPHLVPRAIAVLEREPLAEGDYYPGDLLASVIGATEWLQVHPEWLGRVVRVVERAVGELSKVDGDLRERLVAFLERVRPGPHYGLNHLKEKNES